MFIILRTIIASIMTIAGLLFGTSLYPVEPAHTDTTHMPGSSASLSSSRSKTTPQPTKKPNTPIESDQGNNSGKEATEGEADGNTEGEADGNYIIAPQPSTTLLFQGDIIRIENQRCTLGYIDPIARTATFAAHCVPSGREIELYQDATSVPIGKTTSHFNIGIDNSRSDMITFDLYDTVGLADQPNPYSGDTLLSTDDVEFGDKACSYSAMTGSVRCGTIYNTDGNVIFGSPELGGVQGDSGGPMWLVDDNNNPKGFLGVYTLLTGRIVGYTNPVTENTLGNTDVQGRLPNGTIVHFAS